VYHATHDFNVLIVFSALIGLQVVSERLSILSNGLALSSVKVVNHALVEGEQRSGSTNFSTHVTNGGHTRARKRFNTRTLVFDDSTCASLDG
jgi:hypothetical protein